MNSHLTGDHARLGRPFPRPRGKQLPTHKLSTSFSSRRRSQTDLEKLRQLLADKSARQNALETTGDLSDPAILTEIIHLRVFTALLPRRIAAFEETDAQAETALIETTNDFIHQHLGPRVRELAARTRTIVEQGLSADIKDPAALLVAVARSHRVRTIESLAWSSTIHPARGAIEHAEGALKSWEALDEFEKTW